MVLLLGFVHFKSFLGKVLGFVAAFHVVWFSSSVPVVLVGHSQFVVST